MFNQLESFIHSYINHGALLQREPDELTRRQVIKNARLHFK